RSAERIRRRYLAVYPRQVARAERRRRIQSGRKTHHQGRSRHRRRFRTLSVGRLQERRLHLPCGNNDRAMFRNGRLSVAMGTAPAAIKRQATPPTASTQDEGFAGSMDMVMKNTE